MGKLEDMPIEKASEVIDRFGGIRPMAKKIDVAVTTIQGWKKRDVIPAARAGDVLKAAALHGVDLSGLIADAPPVQQSPKSPDVAALAAIAPGETEKETLAQKPDLDLEIPPTLAEEAPVIASYTPAQGATAAKIEIQPPPSSRVRAANLEGARVQNFPWFSAILALVALGALAALFWPRAETNSALDEQQRLSALEQNVQEIKEKQSFFGTLIPEDLDEQIAALKDQAATAQETIGQAVEKAEEISNDVLAEDAGTLEQRYLKLQDHLAAIAQTPELQAMATRLESWGLQPAGQAQMNSATEELNAVMTSLGASLGTQGAFETALEAARSQSTALNQTFEGVPQNDLKAAALLLGLTQFRSSLGRDNEAFADDLQVLSGLIGDENPELSASLEKLAPYSEQGVLTPAGLVEEFKTMTGDAVVASLKGEDVSLTERAKARMNDMFQVEKNGQLVSGTDTQARMKAAEKLLNEGNLEGAIAEVEALEGPAAEAAAPWLSKAQATVMAQQAGSMIETLTSGLSGAAAGIGLPGTSQRIYNEESGINILKQNTLPQVIKMPKNDNSY
jgi:hypothetical protein